MVMDADLIHTDLLTLLLGFPYFDRTGNHTTRHSAIHSNGPREVLKISTRLTSTSLALMHPSITI